MGAKVGEMPPNQTSTVCKTELQNETKYLKELMEKTLSDISEQNRDISRQNMKQRITERKIQHLSENLERFRNDVDLYHKETTKMKEQMTVVRGLLNETESLVDDVDAYVRRENLRFYNIPELEDETPEVALENFLRRDLKMDPSEQISVVWVCRIGVYNQTKKNKRKRPRTLLARFMFFSDVLRIKEAARRRPKGSKGGVADDLPASWVKVRQEAKPLEKHARDCGKRVYWRGANLYIDGVPMISKQNDGIHVIAKNINGGM